MYLALSALVGAAAVLPLCSAVPPGTQLTLPQVAASEPPAPTSQGKAAPTVDARCICPAIYAPVCAGGKTYPNACTVGCHGITIEHTGPCKEPAPESSYICTAEWDPVCGDGKTYGNACMARGAKAQSITKGECPIVPEPASNCVCSLLHAPVCGDGKTYGNICMARCAKAQSITEGECPKLMDRQERREDLCACPDNLQPVCGDGKTYPNSCEAHCAKAQSITEGECPKLPDPESNCVCPLIYLPVCGDGKTYSNSCAARCAKAQSITDGECPGPELTVKQERREDLCACPRHYLPVCGDGKTYANDCLARCAKAQSIAEGECPKLMDRQKRQEDEDLCICPDIWDPVCGDGVTHANTCYAHCAKAKSITPGDCPKLTRRQESQEICACPRHYLPVCGDGKTYANDCLARCAKAQSITEGECPNLTRRLEGRKTPCPCRLVNFACPCVLLNP
ncbi:hypothetical protein E4U33_006604 [Claviceps sp. LM78 group G4]|nr:hypothetical protein E4U33_006604 [Claviceps sp. LM78 group G4]